MSDIYQKIWDADQSENGISPILDFENGDPAVGFVKVNSKLDETQPDLKVLTEVVIPESKRRTYNLCRVLFDNYALRERDEELDTPQEREEVHDLVHAMVDTAPMQAARDFVAQASGTSISRERWYNTVMEMWFRRFSEGGDPHLTGFEHVVVGEQQGSVAQGYHFWYKYFLDDGFARQVDGNHSGRFPGLKDDRIAYIGSKMKDKQEQFPETVTISYRWEAPDYERKALRPLTKSTGGFFVGCSVEGLLALGTVRAHLGAIAPRQATINGARYQLALHHSPNKHHVRTFFPKFLGTAGSSGNGGGNGGNGNTVASPIRIIASLVNPEGHDPGHESITLINTANTPISLAGWKLMDRNRRTTAIDIVELTAGDTLRMKLDGNGAQLSNKGGEIHLLDSEGRTVHVVTYSKGQVKAQGQTILF